MSLVIIKVDLKERKHAIYSDGIEVSNDYMDILSQEKNKIHKLECCGHSILFGFCGDCGIGRYMSNHVSDYLEEFGVFEKLDAYVDEVEELFIRMFNKIHDTYKEEMHSNDDNITFQCALSIDGRLFSVDKYDGIDAKSVRYSNFLCIGLGSEIATALIENGVSIKKTFETVHRHKTCVGENMYMVSAKI